MMRKVYIAVWYLAVLSFYGCDDENAWDCTKTVGDIRTYEMNLADFNKVEIVGDIELIIENSEAQSVSLTTGENLYPEIDFTVVDGKLTVSDNNKCAWVRKYKNTTLTIRSNNLKEIKNSGFRDVKSNGRYHITEDLFLVSKGTGGDHYLDLEGPSLRISSNESSNFYISGAIERLNIGFYAGESRFEGENLSISQAKVFHRGSNDMILKTNNLLTGSIESFGNIVLLEQPDSINIEFNGPGELIHNY